MTLFEVVTGVAPSPNVATWQTAECASCRLHEARKSGCATDVMPRPDPRYQITGMPMLSDHASSLRKPYRGMVMCLSWARSGEEVVCGTR